MPRRRMKTTRGDWVSRSGVRRRRRTSRPQLGSSYEWAERSLGVGQPNGSLVILYDSQNYYLTQSVARDAAGNDYSLPMAARAAQRRPCSTKWRASLPTDRPTGRSAVWMLWGWRLIVAEQDPEDGAALLDANYTMFDPAAGSSPNEGLDTWANETRMLEEHRYWHSFGDNGQSWTARVRWQGKWRLQTHHALFLFMQAQGGASYTGPIFRTYLRTRVSDDTG